MLFAHKEGKVLFDKLAGVHSDTEMSKFYIFLGLHGEMMDQTSLPLHWHSLCNRLQVSPEEAQETWQELQQRYSEPHRHYHTLEHLAHCLTEFSTAKHLAEDPDLVRLAIYFHDSVYDVQRTDNERQSAQLAVEFGKRNGFDAVARLGLLVMIEATTYQARPEYGDAKLLWDVDLSSLAVPRDEFCENTRKIREEYRSVVPDDAMFMQGRRAFFARFLDNITAKRWPSIYCTDFFRERYEEKAKENVERVVSDAL